MSKCRVLENQWTGEIEWMALLLPKNNVGIYCQMKTRCIILYKDVVHDFKAYLQLLDFVFGQRGCHCVA
jgi:hypothetical protein